MPIRPIPLEYEDQPQLPEGIYMHDTSQEHKLLLDHNILLHMTEVTTASDQPANESQSPQEHNGMYISNHSFSSIHRILHFTFTQS